MATFLSRAASYAALQRFKNNPELRRTEPLEFLPIELRIWGENITLEFRYLLFRSQVNKAVNKNMSDQYKKHSTCKV